MAPIPGISRARGRRTPQSGYTLIELVLVLVIVGILATVALRSLGTVDTTTKYEQTREELDRLAWAVAGNPDIVSGGVRSDYGYVGDIGALPSNLNALATNPGLGTWSGPYISDKLSWGGSSTDYRYDAWGQAYSYAGGVTVQSNGGPSTLTRQIANNTAALLNNNVAAVVVDIDLTPPGELHNDSVRFVLSYPNGAGGMVTQNRTPGADGYAEFTGVPVGLHDLMLVYLPTADTIRRKVNVDPGTSLYTEFQYPEEVWSDDGSGGGGPTPTELEYVADSDTLTTGNCNRLSFWIENNTGASITVTGFTATWAGHTAYYQTVWWDGSSVRSGNPALTSGGTVTFSGSRTLTDGASVQIQIRDFHRNSNGGGPPVDMTGATFEIVFSDGSTINVTADTCP